MLRSNLLYRCLVATFSISCCVLFVLPAHAQQASVTVTPTSIVTHTDEVPRLCSTPTVQSLRNGSWSDPTMWSTGQVPGDDARVRISATHAVSFDQALSSRVYCLEIEGTLTFSTGQSTHLRVGTLTVLPSGTLVIGTAATPVAANQKAEITFLDTPLETGTVQSPGIDPQQYGTGLLGFGTITMHGAPKNTTWTRLAQEPRAGDTELVLEEAVTGWENNTVLLPDTRQIPISDRTNNAQLAAPQREQIAVASVAGNRVQLAQPLQFDHLGAHSEDSSVNYLPHVALLDRNVVLRSENPDGVRGHVLLSGQAAVNIKYARLTGLGRTTALQNLNNTAFDANGNPTAIGTNQIGRYALHLHHLQGPVNPTNTGYQFELVGNTVDAALKWGITVHGTGFGLIQDNVTYDVQGAGFMAEDGSEIDNEYLHNFALYTHGLGENDGTTATGDYARGGSGFWFRRTGNIIRDNAAANSLNSGFYFNSYNLLTETTSQAFRGADTQAPGGALTHLNNPAGVIEGNEAYGVTPRGMWFTYPAGHVFASPGSTLPEVIVRNMRVWHIHLEGIVAYHTNRLTFDGLTILSQASAQDYNTGTGTRGFELSPYENMNFVVRNFYIEGCRYGVSGIQTTTAGHSIVAPLVLEDGYLHNYLNVIVAPTKWHISSQGNRVDIQRVRMTPYTNMLALASTPPKNIVMSLPAKRAVMLAPTVVHVSDYNQEAGNDFYVYYREQHPDYVLLATTPELLSAYANIDANIGSPESGLTNAQLEARYGVYTGGGPAPCFDETSHPEIVGFVCTDPPPAYEGPPRLVLLTPWSGASVPSAWPYVRVLPLGTLPEQWSVRYQLDGGPLVASWSDGLTRYWSVGAHVLRAYLLDAGGAQVADACAVVAIAPDGETIALDTSICVPASLSIDAPTSITVRQGETLRFLYRILGNKGITEHTIGEPVPVDADVAAEDIFVPGPDDVPLVTPEPTVSPMPTEPIVSPTPVQTPLVSSTPSADPTVSPIPEESRLPSPSRIDLMVTPTP